MSNIESLLLDLPDVESARRFFEQFTEKHPSQAAKLLKNEGLLSDALTLASFSPLLAATLIQNPEYLSWLNRKRGESSVRSKEELLESLARFSLTHSQIEPPVLFARFRRRELLRIYLRDIRRLASIAEITEEISNLADAILENALRISRQGLDNRFGSPLETDSKERSRPAEFCVVSLGKLGSKELNYASDIDLLFLYSGEGSTSGTGQREAVTNREYFVKLAESITKLVGQQTGEGSAYRVDLRLRPHGRVGALALSLKDTIRYYQTEARNWERQVLIRSRSSAGGSRIFKKFFTEVEDFIFSKGETVEKALKNVRVSKDKIDFEHKADKGFDVKLGRGGIREIEFIAQALQLAYAGKDRWLRSPHTLISLSRLADRKLLSKAELTDLFNGYEFLRHLEHILQMENGLQTHSVPNEPEKRSLAAKRMGCGSQKVFERQLELHTGNVSRIFARVFGGERAAEISEADERPDKMSASNKNDPNNSHYLPEQLLSAFERSRVQIEFSEEQLAILHKLAESSPKFTVMLASNPHLATDLPAVAEGFRQKNYSELLYPKVQSQDDFGRQLSALRKAWISCLFEIAIFDLFGALSSKDSKRMQTDLAKASIETALYVTQKELARRLSIKLSGGISLAVLGLGKLGGGGVDYDSDLDLVLVYDDDCFSESGAISCLSSANISCIEFFSRFVEIFVTTLSGMTRDGHLYRVDLRLRPYGKSGMSAISKNTFADYMRNSAAIWELLAYLKIRGIAGDMSLAYQAEDQIRSIIHDRAQALGRSELQNETRRVRRLLEDEHASKRKDKEIDIKYGQGGMLDIYFAVRHLQLRDNIREENEDRSTGFMLRKLLESKSLSAENYSVFTKGYVFLSELDHGLRLTVGRSTRLPAANIAALKIVAERLRLSSVKELLEQLTFHRLNIRTAFETIVND